MNDTQVVVPQQLLDHALIYYSLGLSVIPVSRRTKKAALKWKQHQQLRADPNQLQVWFRDADPELLAIAIVCGAVSGNLVVRDFDEQGAYDRWARGNPDLAVALPTVKTGRNGGHGRHVWARTPHPICTKQLKDGHLKAEGSYVVAPPSLHDSVAPYSWLSENWPQQTPILSLDDIARLAGGAHGNTEVLWSSVSLGVTGAHQVVPSLAAPTGAEQALIDLAIERTLPTGPGQRHRKIFSLARRLKAIPVLAGAEPGSLEPIVREWYKRALPFIKTKEFEVTFIDFVDGWKRVRTPANRGSLSEAVSRARVAELPPEAARFDCPELRLLVILCKELQAEAGERSFFLTCRDAADLIGLAGSAAHKQAWKWLGMLCLLGILEYTKRGNRTTANEYRWVNRR